MRNVKIVSQYQGYCLNVSPENFSIYSQFSSIKSEASRCDQVVNGVSTPHPPKKSQRGLVWPSIIEDVVCKERSWDWRACSSCRGPGFCLQHQVVHNGLELQLQWVECLLLASMSSHMQAECMHAHIQGKDLNFKKGFWCWRAGPVVESTCCCCRGLEFDF